MGVLRAQAPPPNIEPPLRPNIKYPHDSAMIVYGGHLMLAGRKGV